MQEQQVRRRLMLALDTPDTDAALDLVRRTAGVIGTYKVGLELFVAQGPAFLAALRRAARDEGTEIFLDLKLHDIPNTVAQAVKAASALGVTYLTVHASGGPKMLQAAQEAAAASGSTRLLAVTALTHLTSDELSAVGLPSSPAEVVSRLAQLSSAMGLFGCVCSPQEAKLVRQATSATFGIVCPGIRQREMVVAADDQARTATPKEAVMNGADFLVVGRPIRTAADPREAALAILRDIEAGVSEREA